MFPDLRANFNLSNWIFFRYLQLCHAYRNSFPVSIKLESDPVKQLLTIIFPLHPTAFGVCYEGHQSLSNVSGWSPNLTNEDCLDFLCYHTDVG